MRSGTTIRPRRMAAALLGAIVIASSAALGQIENPVYLDESPVAGETLAECARLAASGNHAEAARQLQRLLSDEGDRVITAADDDRVARPVRARVHEALLSSPELLEAYRAAEEGRARRDLEEGRASEAERARLLTSAGFESALRVAQGHLEGARFEAARLTLEQLEFHPERAGARGKEAADLSWIVATYLDRAEAWEWASRWRVESGGTPGEKAPAARPALASRPIRSPLAPAPEAVLRDVPGSPLSSAPARIGEAKSEGAARLGVFPTIRGEDLFVSDGRSVACLDRYTLDARWRASLRATEGSPRAAAQPRPGLGVQAIAGEDPESVALAGRVLATASEDPPGFRTRVHALESSSGRELWSVLVPGLDDELEGSVVRGPVSIEGDLVLFSARRAGVAQRLLSVYVGALDLGTGEVRWLRLLASAGSLPFQRTRSVSDVGLVDRGIVYRMDTIGALGAYECATGRPVWVRKLPVSDFGQSELGEPWQGNAPVVHAETILVLTPDRKEVVRLDRRTGRQISSRSASVFGQPQYLLRAGGHLAAVDANSVTFVPLDDFERGPVERSAIVPNTGIRGRAIVSGSSVLVPMDRGVARLDPARPRELAAPTLLDAPGNVVVVEDEIVTSADGSVHAYATWDVVSSLLRARVEASPLDATPAIAYAELAYRAGQDAEIIWGADRAGEALDRAPAGAAFGRSRARLFSSIRAMVEGSAGEGQTIEPGARAGLVDRMGRLADSHPERVAYLMALASLRENAGRPDEAFAAYQEILLDPNLGSSLWRGAAGASRANLEATRRIQALLLEAGYTGYLAFELAAASEHGALERGGEREAEDLERLGARYPASTTSPRAWFEAGVAHARAGRASQSLAAWSAALDRAEALERARVPVDRALMGRIAGHLSRAYEHGERYAAASQLLRRLARDNPGLPIADAGGPMIVDEEIARLASFQAALRRSPRLGMRLEGEVQTLVGWRILPVLSRENLGRASDQVVLARDAEREGEPGEVALWGVAGASTGGGIERPGELRVVWSRPIVDQAPVLLRSEPDAAYLFWPEASGEGPGAGGSLERIETLEGGPGWRTPSFRSFFGPGESIEDRLVHGPETDFEVPVLGSRRLADLLVALDPDHVALVERSGRAAVLDARTGRPLWKGATSVRQVYDVEAGHGVLVIAGMLADPLPDGRESVAPGLMVHDLATGEVLRRLDAPAEDPPRWVQFSDSGLLIMARQAQLVALRLSDWGTAWTISGGAGWEAREAWAFDDRLYVVNEAATGGRQLWSVSIPSGDAGTGPVDAREHLENAGRIDAFRAGDHVAFATDRGVVVVDGAGEVVGRDALDRVGGLLPARPCESHLLVLDSTPEPLDDGRPAFELHALDATTAMAIAEPSKLVLRSRPRAMTLLEDRVVVTAGNVTLVYHAPSR